MKKNLSVLLATIMCMTSISLFGCSPQKNTDEKLGKKDKSEIKGDIKFAIGSWRVDSTNILVDLFKTEYPNVNVEVVGIPGDCNDFITTKAATGDLPDIIELDRPITYALSQGLLAPLNEFIEGDDEINYLDPTLVEDFIIDDNLYALPTRLALNGVFVNTDLMDNLNISKPEYNWTTDKFVELAKKATTSEYSGINELNEFERVALSMFSKDGCEYGYNPKTGHVNYSDGSFLKAMKFREELEAVPGLIALSLKNEELIEQGKEDDYQQKFGKDTEAFIGGKALFMVAGSFYMDWINVNFNYDFYPWPYVNEYGYKQGIHVDPVSMTSTVKEENKEAAFEFLKFISYGVDGNLAKFEARELEENPMPVIYVPPTTHPTVKEHFNSLDNVLGGVKYIYENIDKSYRGDYFKVVPGLWEARNEVLLPQCELIQKGEVDAASVMKDLESKVNKYLDDSKAQLKSDMSKFDHYKVTISLDIDYK